MFKTHPLGSATNCAYATLEAMPAMRHASHVVIGAQHPAQGLNRNRLLSLQVSSYSA